MKIDKNDGWIEWSGGDCPVDSDAIVEVKYRSPNPYQHNNDRAGDFSWSHNGGRCDIIAYRVHKPDAKYRANDDRLEQDLNECIGHGVDIPEWNGEGLPPVGLICEGLFPRHPGISFEWQECLVLYVFEHECAVKSKSTSTLHYCDEFRPLRTEAERARDKLASSLHIAAGASPIELNGIGRLYFKLADAIISGSVFGTTFKAGK